ncbi:YIP1 family protein [Paenibacillus sp. GCM10027626]|uniref:YIP1 family protein n=1 Tax=Paenibacillus sp. GCM10027626 TaxID=3273411 RepID=UPI00362CCA2A
MKKWGIPNPLRCFAALVLLYFLASHAVAEAETPYFTYTSDSEGKTIRTQTSYIPAGQINAINGQKLSTPEHVFVDEQDYVYITDSDLNKVFVLDRNYRFVNELASDQFSSIKSTFVTDQFIYVADGSKNEIYVFDKSTYEPVQTVGKPDAPIFAEGYEFSPTHLAVDVRGNMYVRSTGSINGLIMLNREGEFITFFGANPMKVPLIDQLRSVFLTETQQAKMEKVMPDVPSNIAIDKKGFIYTVTSSVETNPIKKFNVSGTNYFPDTIVGTFAMESVWCGKHNNVYAVNTDGWIFEYDANGNLLFLFGGKDFNSSRLGLLNRPVSIASNSADELLVVDQGMKLIQTYRSTEFADTVHQAMDAYQDGDYDKSQKLWEYTLKYNSIFDKAHIGLGDALLRDGDAADAYEEYKDARYKSGMSEAYWEIRQNWLTGNLDIIFPVFLALIVIGYLYKRLSEKFGYGVIVKRKLAVVRKVKIIDDLLYMFTFLRRPLEGFYQIQYENRVSRLSSTVIYILVVVMLILQYEYTSRLFVSGQGYFLFELSIIVGFAVLWVLSNYLVCSIADGEGRFRDVYNATAYSLSPMIVIMPPLIIFSNALTLEQAVFYHLPVQAMALWIAVLMFFKIKDIQNYEVGETVGVIVRSVFTMLIIALFLFVLYSIGSGLLGFGYDVVTEAGKRWS